MMMIDYFQWLMIDDGESWLLIQMMTNMMIEIDWHNDDDDNDDHDEHY